MNFTEHTPPAVQALRRITEARRILEEVVISSESFDYPKAKAGLKELDRMIRELGREEARLRASATETGAQVLLFPRAAMTDVQALMTKEDPKTK
jgi:hypothetical protein